MKRPIIVLLIALVPVAIVLYLGVDSVVEAFGHVGRFQSFVASYALSFVLMELCFGLPDHALEWLLERGGTLLLALGIGMLLLLLATLTEFEGPALMLDLVAFSVAIVALLLRLSKLGLNEVDFPKLRTRALRDLLRTRSVSLRDSGIAELAALDTWLHRTLKTHSKRQVATWAATLGLLAAFVLFEQRYIPNFLFGPYSIDAAELAAIEDVSSAPHYFVRVSGAEALDTGIEQITEVRSRGALLSRSVSERYYALLIGDRYLICESPLPSGAMFAGKLAPMPTELDARLFRSAAMQARKSRFYPYYLHDTSFRVPGYIAIGIVLLLGAACWVLGVPALRVTRQPALHPLLQRAGAWGDLRRVAADMEREFASRRLQANAWSVTDNFLFESSYLSFDVRRLSDLLWAYPKVTQHSYNKVQTHRTHELMLLFPGERLQLLGKAQVIDEILQFVSARVPWALFGYSAQREAQFGHDPYALAEAVAERRRAHAGRSRPHPNPGFGRNPSPDGVSPGPDGDATRATASSSVGNARPGRGKDASASLRLTLASAMLGGMHEVVARGRAPCQTCRGSGAASEHSPASECGTCNGRGAADFERRVRVKVPPGIDSGQRLRLAAMGLPGMPGASGGDLYVDIEIAPDPRFERRADDLVTRVDVSAKVAALGSRLSVELPDATVVSVRIPPGTKAGERFAIAGYGMPRIHRPGRGDLHVQVRIAEHVDT